MRYLALGVALTLISACQPSTSDTTAPSDTAVATDATDTHITRPPPPPGCGDSVCNAAIEDTTSSAFFDAFRLSAQSFEKPVLYMNGDLHSWLVDKPFPADAPNVTQVQLEGGSAPPVQVTIDHSAAEVFAIEQNPFQ